MRIEQITAQENIIGATERKMRWPAWIIPAIKVSLLAVDTATALGSLMLAFVLREGESVWSGSGAWWSPAFAPYAALLICVVPLRLAANAYHNLYQLRGEFSYIEDGIKVFKATAVGSLLIVAAAFLYRGGFEFRAFSYARGVFLLDFVLALIATGAVRLLVRRVQSFARRRAVNLIPTLVVGRGPEAALCVGEMRTRPELGYRVIGIVDSEPPGEGVEPHAFEGVPVVGHMDALHRAIIETGAAEVIVTDQRVSPDALFDAMMRLGRRRSVEFRVAPTLPDCLPRKTEIDQIGHLPMITLFRDPLSDAARLAKRVFDLCVAGVALGVLSPFWAVIAGLIKLDSRGPVFYKQERVGMDGRIFLFYKFRTMQSGADDRSHREYQRQYIAGDPSTNLGDDYQPVYKLQHDLRVTRVGRFLRRLSLDELPQLLNVLRGDMSVVGPRPPIPYEVEFYDLWHRKRLEIKPGLTGLWQVSGRNRLSFEEMVRLDLLYIENWSLLLDLKIILRTLPVMMRGDAF